MSNSSREFETISVSPLVGDNPEYLAMGKVAELVNECLRGGVEPDVVQLTSRHPELEVQLRQLVPALTALHHLGHEPPVPRDPPAVPVHEAPIFGRLGDYEIIREIGRGGMGVVYEANQVSLNRRVALKVLPFATVLDQRRLTRFKNEAQAAAYLHHQNIVPVYSVGCERGVHYYSMQYIEGQSLSEVVAQLRRLSQSTDLGPRGPAPAPEAEAGASLTTSSNAGFGVAGDLAAGRFAPAARIAADHEPIPFHAARRPLPDTSPLPTAKPTHDSHRQASVSTVADSEKHGAVALSTERFTKTHEFFRTVAHLAVHAASALEHAHGMGVLHRDIKPSNLLLDARGNVWLTDFGLALMESDAGLTMTGDLLGTIRYMSPEQAMAKRVPVDHRTDIYSLGVTLYELLTLEHAFGGNDRQEILRQIAFDDPRPPRRINRAIPAELETIVLKAMAKNPAERYATAQELADDLERFLEDRPIRAKRPSLLQRVGKWTRRHKTMVRTATVTLMAALAVGAVLVWRERAEAVRQRNVARANYGRTHEVLKHFVLEVSDDPRLKAHGLELLRRSLLVKAKTLYEELLHERADDPDVQAKHGDALLLLARITVELGDTPEAIVLNQQANAVFQQLIRTHPETPDYRREFGRGQHNLATLYSTAERFGEAETGYKAAIATFENLVRDHPTDPNNHYDLAKSHNNLGGVYQAARQDVPAEAAYRAAIAIEERLVAMHPDVSDYQQDLAAFHNNLGLLYRAMNRLGPAEAACQKALAGSENVSPTDPKQQLDLAKWHYNLANLYDATGRLEQAVLSEQKALAICERLHRTHPDVPDYDAEYASCLRVLGTMYRKSGRMDDAETNCRKALEIWEKLTRDDPENPNYQDGLAASHNSLGNVYKDTGRMNDADAAFQKVLSIRRDLAQEKPTSTEHAANLAKAQHNLADLFSDMNRMKEAEENFQQALDAWDKLTGLDPENPEYRYALARSQYGKGQVYHATRRPNEAEAAYQRALEVQQKLADELPQVSEYQNLLADIHTGLGVLYRATARTEQAERAYRKAMAIQEKLAEAEPGVLEFAVSCGGTYCNMGNLLQGRGKAEESLDWYARSIQTLGGVIEKAPRHVTARQFIRNATMARAWGLTTLDRYQEALADWDAVLPLVTGPTRNDIRSQRAIALARLGRHAEAAGEADDLAKQENVSGTVLYNAACACSLSSAVIRKDEHVPGAVRDQLAERYAARAMELLSQSRALGFFHNAAQVDHLKNDSDLEPLRVREDFQKLLAELDAK